MPVVFGIGLEVILMWVGRALLAKMIMRMLLGAGLAVVAYHYAVGPLFAEIRGLMSGASGAAANWIGYFSIDKAFTVLASAYTIRMGKHAIGIGKAGDA